MAKLNRNWQELVCVFLVLEVVVLLCKLPIENNKRTFYNINYTGQGNRRMTYERGDYMDKGTDYCVKSTEECKEELLHIISDINDAGTIEYLHTFIKLFIERWG